MRVCNIRPHKLLQQYIDRYWVWENEIHLTKILPGTGAELMFHYRRPFTIFGKDNNCIHLPAWHVLMPRRTFYEVKQSSQLDFISVRFRSGAFRHFCHVPVNEIIDTVLDARDIWGVKVVEVSCRLMEACSLAERIMIIEKFLINCLEKNSKDELWLDDAVDKIYYGYNFIKIGSVIEEYAVSDRQFQRKFKDTMGVAPKFFQKISRFQSVIKYLLINKHTDYLETALDNGYYDQSHFIKDFLEFTGEFPSAFLQEKSFNHHFYNNSI